MKLSALAIVAGAALSIHACSSRDEDVRPDASTVLPDSIGGPADTAAPPRADTIGPTDSAPPSALPERPARPRRGDSTPTAPPERKPPIGDPAPIDRPPVKLPRGDST